MAHESIEAVHRIAAAVGQRDVSTFLELTDPAVEWDTSLSVISAGARTTATTECAST
jgi:uncharacterized protein with GYD domain